MLRSLPRARRTDRATRRNRARINPDDRYVPFDCVQVDLIDQRGVTVRCHLTRRTAIALADQLLALIPTLEPKGGAK